MAEDNGKLDFKAGIDTTEFEKGIKKVSDELGGLGNESTKTDSTIKKNNDSTATSFLGLGNSVKGLGSVFMQLASSFGLFAGVAGLVGILSTAIRDIAKFDKSMTNLAAIAGVSRSELKGLEQDIRKVASESLNTANEVADMAMELIKLGTTPDGVRALLKPVNDLSIAFQASADSVAVLLKGTLNAFNAGENQAQRFADVMAMSANKTALGFNEIADAFTYIASSAGAMGYSIEQTSAMMGVLVDNNVQASSAGRVLSSTFGRLAKQGKTLEGELLRVANAQDKVKESAKIFGAEGARLGLILANNIDKMSELTEEFNNAEGSLSKLTEAQLESLTARVQLLASAWQEVILKIEDGNGALAKFIKNGIDGVTWWIEVLGNMMVSAEDMRNKMINEASSNAIKQVELTVVNMNPKTQEDALKASMQFAKTMAKQTEIELEREQAKLTEMNKSFYTGLARQMQGWFGAITGGGLATRKEAEAYEMQKAKIEAAKNALNAYNEAAKNGVEIGLDKVQETETTNELLDTQIAFLDKLSKLERGLNDSVLNERDLVLSRIVEKYKDLVKEAEKLGMSTARIAKLEQQELEVATYKLDTNDLLKSLDEQESLYQEYQNAIDKIGLDGAKKMYADLINVNQDYFDTIQDELEKLDWSNMSQMERNRYDELTKMALDYSKEKSRIERNQMQELFLMTQNVEARISETRLKYAKLGAQLKNQYEGQELASRQNELAKQAKAEFDALNSTIMDGAKKYADVTELVAGATRNQIESQIKSLTNYVNTTKDLTQGQIDVIQAMIDKLRGSLSSAEGSSIFGDSMNVVNEYESISNSIVQLTKNINDLNDAYGKGASETAVEIGLLNTQIDGLKKRQDDLKFDALIASGNDLANLGQSFLDMANDAEFANGALGDILGTLGKFINTSGSVLGALGNIGKGFSDIKGAGGLGAIFGAGKESGGLLGGLGSVAGALGPIASGASAIFGVVSSIGKKQREEYNLFRQWQSDVIKGEREYQALLRGRKYEGVSTNQPDKDLLTQQLQIAKQNQIEASRQYLDQLEHLQKEGSQIIDRYRKKGLFGSKTKTKWGDLVGVDFDELEMLDMTGKLEGETKAWFDELKKVKEELDDIGLTLEDLAQSMKELMTGTNWQQMSNTFADMFANGTNSAINFANTLEDVIKTAIVSGFKANYIDKEMQAMFEELAKISEDGEMTQAEIDKFTEDALRRMEELQKNWDRITGGLDLDFSSSGQDVSGRDTVKRITEVQADLMTGAIMGMQVSIIDTNRLVENQTNILSLNNKLIGESIGVLVAIERNTFNTVSGVEGLRSDVQQLQIIMKDNNNRLLGL